MAKLNAIVRKEDGIYVVTCPEVGTASQGKTLKEALKNLKEATELYLEEFPSLLSSPAAFLTFFEVSKNARAAKKPLGI